jgi:hypothetical protein
MDELPSAEVLREVWRITERRGGAVFKTEYVEDRWVPIEERSFGNVPGEPDLIYATKSTSFEGQTIRRKK